MAIVRLVHWKPEQAEEGIRLLAEAGFEVQADPVVVSGFLRELESERPDALLIDLSRAPSQGRDLAVALRMRKGTRSIPLVFVGGVPEKVEKIQEMLPDAGYADWENVAAAIEAAINVGAQDPIVPESIFAAYAGKPLAGKLGIKPDLVVGVAAPPDDFEATLGKPPAGAIIVGGADPNAGLTIWFVRTQKDLRRDMTSIIDASKRAPVWIAWPKKGSELESDLAQQVVRRAGMTEGMVDYKICSIDKVWSALLFKWRGKEA